VLQFETRPSEAVGFDHVGPGSDVAARDIEDFRALFDAPEFGALTRLQALLLEKSAPGAVGNEDFAGLNRCQNAILFHAVVFLLNEPE
jgi:hypothetical protein